MKLIPDLREFIELLNSESVQYLVIGGWAYNRYAEPRFTGDIDFFVEADADAERKMRHVLTLFGFSDSLPRGSSIFETPVIMLGKPPHRIDLISRIDGLDFAEVWDGREAGELDGLPVHFISREHLLINKRAAGRDKDIADAKVLERLIAQEQSES